MDPRLFLHHSADPADSRRHRSGRNRPQLSGGARPDGGCPHLPAAGSRRTRPPRRPHQARRCPQEMAGGDRHLSQGMGQVRRPRIFRRHHADQSAARGGRDRQGVARECHSGQRHRRPPQLAVGFLQAETPGLADRLDGFWPDGLWRCRRDGGEVRRTRPALRVGMRRRRVLHACQRAGNGGRI